MTALMTVPLARGDDGLWVIFIIVALAAGLGMWIWGKARGASMLQTWAAANGFRLLESEERGLLKGPFFWTASKNQKVYRVTVEYPDGALRRGWVRCGGWFLGLMSDQVDVRWDDPDPRETAPGGFPVVLPHPQQQPTPSNHDRR
jgi:hypothetical protein